MANYEKLLGEAMDYSSTSITSEKHLDYILNEEKLYLGGHLSFADTRYLFKTPRGREALALLATAVVDPQQLASYPWINWDFSPQTSGRGISMEWEDQFGPAVINLKGISLVPRTTASEARDYLRWHEQKMTRKVSNLHGKQFSSDASEEVNAWGWLFDGSPEFFDYNLPIWRPIAVMTRSGLVYHQESFHKQGSADRVVVSLRRFPFTAHRLDEFVFFTNPSAVPVDRLRRKWGLETAEQVYLRAIRRLGWANWFLHNNGSLHEQIFSIETIDNLFGGTCESAWMNFNNVAIDGSIGDLDSTEVADGKEIEKDIDKATIYTKKLLNETFGSSIMYLTFVGRMNPELVASDEFLAKYFSAWKKGLGELNWELMQIDPFVDTFDKVISSFETTIRFSSSQLDTSPGNTDLNGGDYLSHFKKETWIPALAEVIRRVKQMRPAVGL